MACFRTDFVPLVRWHGPGRSIPTLRFFLPVPEVMAMKDELAELRAFKATTTPAATTGAAHPGKRARVQQDRLPEIARFRGAARSFRYFQFRGEGETVRELSVSNRAGQEIFINTMSVARSQAHQQSKSQARAKQEPSIHDWFCC